MTYNHDIHHRRSIRLKDYDYSQAGAYFVTICTNNREYMFGDIINGEMQLNDAGTVAQQCWNGIPQHFPNVVLDEFIVMPNHIHGIVIFNVGAKNVSPGPCDGTPGSCDINPNGAKNGTPGPRDINPNRAKNVSPLQHGTSMTIGSVIRGFKIGVTKWFRQDIVGANDYLPQHAVWQRNYYEHIIRNETELEKIREYIVNNPLNWETDENYI